MYIPLSTARSRFGETLIRRTQGSFESERVQLHEIRVQFRDSLAVERSVPLLETLLERFHEKRDYELIVPLELLRSAVNNAHFTFMNHPRWDPDWRVVHGDPRYREIMRPRG
jgi:hypothetical protein